MLFRSFVDDTNLWLTGTYPFTPTSTLVSTMQRVAQVWERLLFASSGALALQKCFYYLVCWKWTPHGFPFLTSVTDSPTTPLQMTSGRSTLGMVVEDVDLPEVI